MSYRIADEPAPGALGWLAVNPLWPLLAVMLAGTWMSWPWFAVNAFAFGSPTRGRETALVVLAFAGTLALLLGLSVAAAAGIVSGLSLKLAVVLITAWKIGATYLLYVHQAPGFELYEYYGGQVQRGIFALAVAYFVSNQLLGKLPLLPRLILG